MKFRIDTEAAQEDARKLGIALMVAGAIASIIQGAPPALGAVTAGLGWVFFLLGVLRRSS